MIKRALGQTVNAIADGGHVVYKTTRGVTLYDTRIHNVDTFRAILFLEGLRKQEENRKNGS